MKKEFSRQPWILLSCPAIGIPFKRSQAVQTGNTQPCHVSPSSYVGVSAPCEGIGLRPDVAWFGIQRWPFEVARQTKRRPLALVGTLGVSLFWEDPWPPRTSIPSCQMVKSPGNHTVDKYGVNIAPATSGQPYASKTCGVCVCVCSGDEAQAKTMTMTPTTSTRPMPPMPRTTPMAAPGLLTPYGCVDIFLRLPLF